MPLEPVVELPFVPVPAVARLFLELAAEFRAVGEALEVGNHRCVEHGHLEAPEDLAEVD